MSFGVLHDASTNCLEETRYKKKHDFLIHELTKSTHFKFVEIQKLILIYYKLKNQASPKQLVGISDIQLYEVLFTGFRMVHSAILDRVIMALEAMVSSRHNEITIEIWVTALSLLLRGTLEEKIDFCFNVYSLSNDGMIGRDTGFYLLRKAMISSGSDDDAEEIVKDLVETLMQKMDLDKDGKISYDDYKTSVLRQPLLLESFGQCLPSRVAVHSFQRTVFTGIPDII